MVNQVDPFDELRRRAEQRLQAAEEDLKHLSTEEAHSLIQELRIHQIELELQNEELRNMQSRLELTYQRYSDLFNYAPVGYFYFNDKGVIQDINLSATDMLESGRQNLLNKPMVTYLQPESHEIFFNHINQLMKRSMPVDCELKLRTRSGNSRVVRMFSNVTHAGDGKESIRATMLDITQQKQAEEYLIWHRDTNEALAKLSTELLIASTIEEMSDSVLKYALHMTGSQFGYVGHVDPETGYLVCSTMTKEIWEVCQVEKKDFVFKEFGGLWGWVLINKQPLLTNNPADDPRSSGTPEGHIPIRNFLSVPAMIVDEVVGQITLANTKNGFEERDLLFLQRMALIYAEAVRSQKMLGILNVSQKMADLGTLAAGMAHEINSPVQIITGRTDTLLRRLNEGGYEPESFRKALESINQSAWRVAEIVRSLLGYARPSSNDQVGQHSLNHIIQDALLLVEHQLKSWSTVSVKTELDEQLPPIYCQRNNVIQVLLNLVNNARDSMPTGGTITVRTRREDGGKRQVIEVQDNGRGIPREHHDKIFNPFFTTKSVGKGTGLGLFIARDIISAHGGEIRFASREGEGTVFSVFFPEGSDQAASRFLPDEEQNGRFG